MSTVAVSFVSAVKNNSAKQHQLTQNRNIVAADIKEKQNWERAKQQEIDRHAN